MSDRIQGSAVATAFAEAVDEGSTSGYRRAIFWLGVAAGQYHSRGWSAEELEREISNLAIYYPGLATQIRQALVCVDTELQALRGRSERCTF